MSSSTTVEAWLPACSIRSTNGLLRGSSKGVALWPLKRPVLLGRHCTPDTKTPMAPHAGMSYTPNTAFLNQFIAPSSAFFLADTGESQADMHMAALGSSHSELCVWSSA